MKAIVKNAFYDTCGKVTRRVGEEIEITRSRFDEINGHGDFLEEVNDDE